MEITFSAGEMILKTKINLLESFKFIAIINIKHKH